MAAVGGGTAPTAAARPGGEKAMERINRWLIRDLENECGQDMVEYALIVSIISIPIVLAAIVISPAITPWAHPVAEVITGT